MQKHIRAANGAVYVRKISADPNRRHVEAQKRSAIKYLKASGFELVAEYDGESHIRRSDESKA